MKYFEEKVQAGEWEEVEKYLAGFTKVDDNRCSMKIFFEMRKQKYLEAFDRYILLCILLKSNCICAYYGNFSCCLSLVFLNFRQDKAKIVEILVGDLKVFSTFNEELYKKSHSC